MLTHARTWSLVALAAVVATALCVLAFAPAVAPAPAGAGVLADAHGVPATFVFAAADGAPLGATQSSPPSVALLAGVALATAACSPSVRRRTSLGRAALFAPLRI